MASTDLSILLFIKRSIIRLCKYSLKNAQHLASISGHFNLSDTNNKRNPFFFKKECWFVCIHEAMRGYRSLSATVLSPHNLDSIHISDWNIVLVFDLFLSGSLNIRFKGLGVISKISKNTGIKSLSFRYLWIFKHFLAKFFDRQH